MVPTGDSSGLDNRCPLERLFSYISQKRRITVSDPDPNATVSAFRVYNSGGFVIDIHALYSSGGGVQHKAENGDNFDTGQARTMDLAAKCVAPVIEKGDLAQVQVWVEAGDDKTYPFEFLYDPAGPVQSFTIGGTVHDDRLDYEQALPPAS
jgi:hypothetical protein